MVWLMVWVVLSLLIVPWLEQLWSESGFQFTVLASLGANLVVGIMSWTRRRRPAPGCRWWVVDLGSVFILWLAYQVVGLATTSAIGKVSLCGSDASEVEKKVAAFWAPFLLLQLGGTDNLTAYALEENKISARQLLETIIKICGVGYTIYSNLVNCGSRSCALLLAASVLMAIAGAFKYMERTDALQKANWERMQEGVSSSSNSKDDASSSSSSSSKEDDEASERLECKIKMMKKRSLGDKEALFLAQDLFPVWRHALVDSSVDPRSKRQQASEMIISESEWDWESKCKVAEMELSLIYDFLYTKAILAHGWFYYLIRLLSPLFTAAAAFLFNLWMQQQQLRGHRVRGYFVWITNALLALTLLMDVVWLLRALGSPWAYGYLQQQAPAWLCHQALHTAGRWWWRLHGLVVSLDPLWLLFCRDPFSYKRWSGTIGRYNLLHECSGTRRRKWQKLLECISLDSSRVKETWYLQKLPQCVKKELFERVTEVILKQAIVRKEKKEKDEEEQKKVKMERLLQGDINKFVMETFEAINKCVTERLQAHIEIEVKIKQDGYTREDIRTRWGQKASKSEWPFKLEEDDPSKEKETKTMEFGMEFEEDVLLWHIATCMVLPHIQQKDIQVCAIEVMSEYMMFLVALRRQMLPGLVLHSQLQVTQDTLKDLWARGKLPGSLLLSDKEKEKYRKDEEQLAMMLRRAYFWYEEPPEKEEVKYDGIPASEGTLLLERAVNLYLFLSGHERPDKLIEGGRALEWPPESQKPIPAHKVQLIFNVWVDKLVYAAVRCSRDAHAKQLSAGGDLTTVIWMLIQHAGPFSLGEWDAKNMFLPMSSLVPGTGPQPPRPQPPARPELTGPPPPTTPAFPPTGPELTGPPPPTTPAFQLPGHWPPRPHAFLMAVLELIGSWLAGTPPTAGPPTGTPTPPWTIPVPEHQYPPPICPPSYPPVCPPCYDPSWPHVCPWYPQCPLAHEEPGHEPDEDKEDEHEDSSSDKDSEE